MKVRITSSLFALVFPVAVFAASPGDTYAGVQYALVTYDEDGFDEAEPTALVGRLGRFVNDNFAVEGRFGIGLQDDSIDVGPFDIDIEVDTLIGVYGMFQAPTANGSVYGIIGFTQGELEGSAFGVSVSEDESGLSYGFGVNFKNFNLEYMSYLDEDDFDVTAIGIGYSSQF